METKGKPLSVHFPHSNVTLTTDGKATVAEVELYIGDTLFTSTGSSWRASGDKNDVNKGRVIAVYRAVTELKDVLKLEVEKLDV